MGLRETTNCMKKILERVQYDLLKAEKGNKTASQRVRTATIHLAKIAKAYRKESLLSEKKQLQKTYRKKR